MAQMRKILTNAGRADWVDPVSLLSDREGETSEAGDGMNNADSVTVTRPSRRRQETTTTRLGAWLFFVFSWPVFFWLERQGYPSTAAGHVTRTDATASNSNPLLLLHLLFFFSSSFFANCVLCTLSCVLRVCACLCLRFWTLDFFWSLDIACASFRVPLWLISCAQSTHHLPHLTAVAGKMKWNTLQTESHSLTHTRQRRNWQAGQDDSLLYATTPLPITDGLLSPSFSFLFFSFFVGQNASLL